MNNIAFIYSGKKGKLPTLEPDRNEVKRVLTTFGDWESDNIVNKELDTLKQFKEDLARYQDYEIENLLFYFTGHGTREGIEKKELYLNIVNEEPRNMNEFLTAIFTILRRPKRIAIILDSCFSGTFINNHDIISDSFEILTSSDPINPSLGVVKNSSLSLFTGEFCKAIETLRGTNKEITLDTIYDEIKDKLGSYTCIPSAPMLIEGRINIAKNSTYNLLKSLQTNLKKVIPDKSILKLYASNILSQDFDDVNISAMNYDEIVEHLYDLRQPIVCLLKNLNRMELKKDFIALQLEFTETNLDACCSDEKMKYEFCNLLIKLEPIDDDISRTQVRIWRHEEPYAMEVADLIVDLESKENPTDLIDMIFSTITVSENNVLLEFMMPYELIDIDMTLWTTSYDESLVETYRLVRRVSERIEKYRDNEGKMKSWEDFWGFYKKNKDKSITDATLPHDKKIRFINFKNTPYIRIDEQLSMEQLNKIINTSASIVITPTKDNRDELNVECVKIQNDTLHSLIEKDFEWFCDVPHILIWDNPNRQIRINPEITGGD